jgi:hypothetical protein
MMSEMKYTLAELVRAGVITAKPAFHLDISQKVISLQNQGFRKAEAIRSVAQGAGVTVATVYRALELAFQLKKIESNRERTSS